MLKICGEAVGEEARRGISCHGEMTTPFFSKYIRCSNVFGAPKLVKSEGRVTDVTSGDSSHFSDERDLFNVRVKSLTRRKRTRPESP